jgi:hypothetical protein
MQIIDSGKFSSEQRYFMIDSKRGDLPDEMPE